MIAAPTMKLTRTSFHGSQSTSRVLRIRRPAVAPAVPPGATGQAAGTGSARHPVHRLGHAAQCVPVELRHVDLLGHGRREPPPGLVTAPPRLGPPARRVARQWPCFGFQVVQQGLHQMRLYGVSRSFRPTASISSAMLNQSISKKSFASSPAAPPSSPAARRRSSSACCSDHRRMSSS